MKRALRTCGPVAALATGFFTVLAGSAGAQDKNWNGDVIIGGNWFDPGSWNESSIPVDGEYVRIYECCAENDVNIDNGGDGVNLGTSRIQFENKTNLYDATAGDLSDVGGGSYDTGLVDDALIADEINFNGSGGGAVDVYVPVTATTFNSNRHGANFYVPYTVTTIEARSGHQDKWNFNVSPTAPIDTVIIDENRGPDGGNTDGYVAFNADTQVTSLTLVWSNLRVGAGATLSVGTVEYSDFTNQATDNNVTPIHLNGDMVVGTFNITDVAGATSTPLALGTYGALGNPGVDNQVPWITEGDGTLTVVGNDRLTLVAGTTYPTMDDTAVLNTAALNSSVGTLIGLNNVGVPAPATFSLAAGTGDADNGNYTINGNQLEVHADLTGLANDTPQSIRIEADFGGGDVFAAEFAFIVKIDSDTDGLVDDWETSFGALGDFAMGADKDSDGLNDETEFVLGTVPNNADPDLDDSPDGEEIARQTDPADPDTDNDGLKDGHETDTGTYVSPTNTGTDPLVDDTDGDGLLDGDEVAPSAPRAATDPNKADTDGDGLSDLVETNDDSYDDANDTGTDPTLPDSDGDGVGDSAEIIAGSDPNDISGVPAAPDLATGLEAYWPFDADASDLSSNGHDGTLVNNAAISSGTMGFVGEALSLGGGSGLSADHMTAGDPTSFDFNTDFTWHAYIKATNGRGIIGRAPAATNHNQGSKTFFLNNQELRWDTGWVGQPRTFQNIRDDMWHQVTATYEAATDNLKIYVDPLLTSPLPVLDTTHNVNRFDEHTHVHNGGMADETLFLGIGSINFQNAGLVGLMDEVAIWDRVLNGYEIAYLHEQGLAGTSLADLAGLVVKVPQLNVDVVGGNLEFSWTPTAGKVYDILSDTTLDAGTDPATWPVFGSASDLPASPHTEPLPVDTERYFVLLEKEAPPLFSEDFETSDGGFTMVNHSGGTGTTWAYGDPASTGEGGTVDTGNDGSTNCWGTDIGTPGFYANGTDTSLVSRVIDLTGVAGATLSFAQALDILDGDSLVVNVIDDTTDTVLESAVHTSTPDTDINGADWTTVSSISITGGQPVRIEWHFTGNGDGTYLGAYIDDVAVKETP